MCISLSDLNLNFLKFENIAPIGERNVENPIDVKKSEKKNTILCLLVL